MAHSLPFQPVGGDAAVQPVVLHAEKLDVFRVAVQAQQPVADLVPGGTACASGAAAFEVSRQQASVRALPLILRGRGDDAHEA